MDRLSYGDCVRLTAVCKSRRSIVKQTNVSATPRLPWLLSDNMDHGLRFYDFYEFRPYKFKLPEILAGSSCKGVSKGWVVLRQHAVSRVLSCKSQSSVSRIFLYNPISGDRFRIPSYPSVFKKIELSSVDALNPDCMIAAIFYKSSLLAICGRQDQNWSVYDRIDNGDKAYIEDILFSKGVLYVLVGSYSSKQETQSAFATCTMRVGDRYVILKIIHCNGGDFSSRLVESDDGQLWIVLHTLENLEVLPIDFSNSTIGPSTRLNKTPDGVLILTQGRSLLMSTTYFSSPYNDCFLCNNRRGNYNGLMHILIHSKEEKIKLKYIFTGLCSKTWFTPNIC